MVLNKEAAGVRLDPRYGHVSIYGHERYALVTMVETGPRLEIWSGQGAHISPKIARELAAALIGWAERREVWDRAEPAA